ncbi:MAG: glycerophosphodiester phosphodiesterase [Saprospiraceae bacterium]|nr:glycerophosphodiester phosphodiesterase [Saprospiraceae bacterium]
MQQSTDIPKNFDWQGHRGARGLAPENTVAAFLKAMEYPEITTLELDVAIAADSQVVVSHEPWMSETICSHPDGRPVEETEAKSLNLHRMRYTEIKGFDCGKRGHVRFPEQLRQAAAKPLLREVVEAVNAYCKQNRRPVPRFNIEIKSKPEWDGIYTPVPEVFARLLLAEIETTGIRNLTCIQSFDKRALQAVHQLAPELTMALLIEDAGGVQEQLAELGFTPKVFSPYYQLVTAHLVKAVHEAGMRIIPWTVNETETMKSLIALGVDGIITDYPDRIPR